MIICISNAKQTIGRLALGHAYTKNVPCLGPSSTAEMLRLPACVSTINHTSRPSYNQWLSGCVGSNGCAFGGVGVTEVAVVSVAGIWTASGASEAKMDPVGVN
jgi:hypothetical protein